MGSVLSSSMADNMKKLQVNQIERQMEMQKSMREQQMAIQIASSRDLFHWFGAFYVTYGAAAVIGFKKTGNKAIMAPAIPFTFIFGYIGHMAYGGKVHKIRNEAAQILDHEQSLLHLPHPFPTIDDLDERRRKNKEARIIQG